MAVPGQKQLNVQTPNSNSPVCTIDVDVSGMLLDGSGKPVTGHLNAQGFMTAAWRYLFQAVLAQSNIFSTLQVTGQSLLNLVKAATLQISGILGYGPSGQGIGGAVTQITSITTSVTLNKPSGQITTVSNAFVAGTPVQFAVIDSVILATDTIVLTALNSNILAIPNGVTNGGFGVTLYPLSTGTFAVLLNFAVVRSVSN